MAPTRSLPSPVDWVKMSMGVAGADPKRAIGVDQKRADEIVGQAVRGGDGCDGAVANAIESVGSAHPEVAGGGCGERKNDVAGEAAVNGVSLDASDGASAVGNGVESAF